MTGPTELDVARAAASALGGGLIVMPTDTVYGIGTRPDDPGAMARLFEAKRRPRDLELPVLIASLAEAESVGELGDDARALAARFWPGSLTIVVRRRPRSADWELGGNPDTIGLRVPDNPTALAVLERTGPLAVTSANLSGSPTLGTCEEIDRIFGTSVAVTLCRDEGLSGTSSTVVDCTGESPVVIRAGAITAAEITQAIPNPRSPGRPAPESRTPGD